MPKIPKLATTSPLTPRSILFACLAIDPATKRESLMGAYKNNVYFPLVSNDERNVDALRAAGKMMAANLQCEFRLAKFSLADETEKEIRSLQEQVAYWRGVSTATLGGKHYYHVKIIHPSKENLIYEGTVDWLEVIIEAGKRSLNAAGVKFDPTIPKPKAMGVVLKCIKCHNLADRIVNGSSVCATHVTL